MKVGRNAPCPCGSGKKAKHCVHVPPLKGNITPSQLWWSSPGWEAEGVRIDDLYEAFWDLPTSPDASRIDVFLERVFDQAEACNPEWHEMLRHLQGFNYLNIESFIWRVFEHVPDEIIRGDDDQSDLPFFAWAATEILAGKNPEALPRLVDVIAARKDTYDADACAHIEHILTDSRSEDGILRYAESMQQCYADDEGLVAWANSYSVRKLIALRMAQIWREREADRSQPLDLPDVEAKVMAGFTTDDLEPEILRHILFSVLNEKEITVTLTDFNVLVTKDAGIEERGALLIGIYQGFLRFGDICGFQPVTAIAHAEHLIQTLLLLGDTKQGVNNPFDLLEDPSNLLEPFIVAGSHGMMGIDVRRARMLINAFKICCRIGATHKILNEAAAVDSETELERLSGLLDSLKN